MGRLKPITYLPTISMKVAASARRKDRWSPGFANDVDVQRIRTNSDLLLYTRKVSINSILNSFRWCQVTILE